MVEFEIDDIKQRGVDPYGELNVNANNLYELNLYRYDFPPIMRAFPYPQYHYIVDE